MRKSAIVKSIQIEHGKEERRKKSIKKKKEEKTEYIKEERRKNKQKPVMKKEQRWWPKLLCWLEKERGPQRGVGSMKEEGRKRKMEMLSCHSC